MYKMIIRGTYLRSVDSNEVREVGTYIRLSIQQGCRDERGLGKD